MIACPPILSEEPPKPARRAGLGDRFRYWRGGSGRRYLFSLVPAEVIADFRSVVVLAAEPTADGQYVARALSVIDQAGKGAGEALAAAGNLRVFVHFLAANEADRRRLVDDVAAAGLRLAA